MNILSIKIQDDKVKFLPDEEIYGEVMWNLQKVPIKIVVNLFWFTEGKGTPDSEIVNSIELEPYDSSSGGKQPFRFKLPPAPHSFSGNLISLKWAIEVLAPPLRERDVYTFTMSPLDNPVVLKSVPPPGIFKTLKKFNPFRQMPMR